MEGIHVEVRDWDEVRHAAGPIRYAIFIETKNPPAGIELDEMDSQCRHALATDASGAAIGTGRLLPDGQIGRLAVPKEWWRRGVGAALIQALTEEARKRGSAHVIVSASLQAAEFYRDLGFIAEGKVGRDGDQLSQKMRKPLS